MTTYCPRCLLDEHYGPDDCTPHPAAEELERLNNLYGGSVLERETMQIMWDEDKESYENQIHQINEELERLTAENARLREALGRIAAGFNLPNGGHCTRSEANASRSDSLREAIQIARTALEVEK